jgi:RNA polymerase sigma factor (sigma-70 family)
MDLTLASQETASRCGECGREYLVEFPVPDDRTFYEELIAPIESQMMRSIWRVVRHPELAEDALQDALAIIWRKRDLIRRHPNPRALVLKICLNAACDSLRKRNRFLPRQTDSLSAQGQDISDPSDVGRQERKRLEGEVLKAIARLPKKQAAAVLMRIVQDQPYDAIAKALGCSEVTVRIQVSKGRARLSRWLSHLRPGSPKEGSR